MSSTETVLKKSTLGRYEGAGCVKKSVLENESLILVILSKKKVTKRLVRHSRKEYTFRIGRQCRT